jgi:hypothetical protein
MTDGSIRFLHTSDCHLERTLQGACELPERLREWFTEAPYRATQRLFDAAISESVDFVVLAGDVLDANLAGPRGRSFCWNSSSACTLPASRCIGPAARSMTRMIGRPNCDCPTTSFNFRPVA